MEVSWRALDLILNREGSPCRILVSGMLACSYICSKKSLENHSLQVLLTESWHGSSVGLSLSVPVIIESGLGYLAGMDEPILLHLLDYTLAPFVGYPSATYIAGQACSGISFLGAGGQGFFCPGTWVAV